MVMTLRMPEELYESLKKTAQSRGISMNAYVLLALWNFIKM